MRQPTVAESRRATELGGTLGEEAIIDRAALQIRCADCDGYIIGAIAYIEGRPLAAVRQQDDRLVHGRRIKHHWDFSWADRGSRLHARCRVTRHALNLDQIASMLPPPGHPHDPPLRVSHPPAPNDVA